MRFILRLTIDDPELEKPDTSNILIPEEEGERRMLGGRLQQQKNVDPVMRMRQDPQSIMLLDKRRHSGSSPNILLNASSVETRPIQKTLFSCPANIYTVQQRMPQITVCPRYYR